MPPFLAATAARSLAVTLHSPLALHAAQQSGGSSSSGTLTIDILLVLAGVVIGRIWGRRAGLKHLGAAEFRTRWTAVRRQRRW